MSLLDDLKKKVQDFGGKVQEAARQELQRREAAGEDVSTTSTRESVRENLQTAFEPITKAANSLKERFTYRDYSAKNPQSKKWYKGDTPTHSETLARIYQLGEEDPTQREELWNLYQQEASNPTSPLYERYGQATSQYLTALGLTADQVNDDFFAANADLFDYGVTTAAGNLSTAKRNGPEALLAADLKGLYDDYQKTKALQAEQDQAMKEAKYWMAQGLTDDEIKAKLDIGGANSKYKNLYKAMEKTATGEYEPTTAPIQLLTSYGVDGMLYSLRNPDSSTGDYLLDAVQREMGRGVKGPEASDSRRDMTSASYAPYAVGMAGMDEYGIKYNRTSFDRDWLNSPEGLAVRNNPETTKDYAAIWEAVENTETYKAAVDEFNTDVRAMIEAGASPEEIFSSEMLDDYPEVKKLYEAQQKGMPLKTASAIDFDISAMYDEADKAYKANVGKISSEAYDTDVSAKLGTPSNWNSATAGTQTQTAEQMRVARSIFAPYATPSELNVFKTIGPSYGDTKGAVLNGITNGTSGEDQAYLSAMDAADMYAAEFYLPSVQKMNSLNREKELFDKYEAFLAEWEPRLAKEGHGIMGTDEFKAAQAEIEAAEAVWDKYDGSPDELNAAIENEKKIQQNIDRKYGDAQLLNKNGITGLSVKPMLDFAAQFESFVPSRYADTEWGARMSKGESWDAVSKDMEKAKASNDQLLLMIDTTLKQAEKFGINKEYTAGLERAKEALLEENQLIEFTSARGNKDYSSRIAEVDGMDLQQAVASADVNLLPDRIMMAVFSPDTLASKMTGNTMYEELALAPRMTEQEVNDYKYYLAESPEKAAEYYNALTPMLRVRAAQEMEEQAAADVDTIGGGIGASIASVLVNTAQGFMLPSMALKSAAGEEIDPYSIEFLPSLYSQTARSEIKGNIKGKFGDGSWQEKALNFAYDAVMTGADSTAAAIVGKPFGVTGKIGERAFEIAGGLMLQSSSAAMSTLMDVKMRGGTDAQAWEMAGITAAAEAASEYLPMENLSKMMDKGLKSGFKTELLKQIASDAPGEMLSELLGSVSDQVIMQELSNWEASYNQYVESGLSEDEARKQADLDVWKGIGYAGLLSVGTSAGSVTMAAGIGKVNKTLFKSRAETVLSEATAKGASKADQTATVSAAMESMGTDPVEADAAAQAMASVDPNAAATVQSILVHTEDPAVVDAIRLGSMVPDSQTGQILATIQQEGATDENVQTLVETAQAENAVPEIQNQYETALTSSVEAMASVNAMLGSDNSNVAAAKEAVTQAEQNLKVQQQSIAEAEGEMQAATSVLQNAKKRFNAKPADQKAKASVTKAIARYQQAQGHLEQVRATTDIAKAQEDLKAARAGLESARNEALTAARQAAQTVVQETMSQREQRHAETAMATEVQRQADNTATLDAEDFIASQLEGADLTEEDRQKVVELIKERSIVRQQNTKQDTIAKVKWISGISKKFGVKITIKDTTEGGQYLRYNGVYDPKTDSVVIDTNATQGEVLYGVLLHELTHRAERSGTYQEFASAILKIKYGDNDQQLAADIKAKQESYNSRLKAMSALDAAVDSTPLTADEASREIVADLTHDILYGDAESIQKLVAEQPSVAKRILETIKNFVNKLKGINDPAIDQLNKARELFESALTDTAQTDGRKQYALRDVSIPSYEELANTYLPVPGEKKTDLPVKQEIKTDSGEVAADIIRGGVTKQYSLASWTAKERKTVRDTLVKNGYAETDVDKWISDVDGVASIVSNDKARLDFDADPDQVMLKNNQEYVKTLDASTLCAKRLLYQGTFNEIQHMLPNTVLTSDDLLDLLNVMKEAGYETPCGICYVESRRRHLGKFAEQWLHGRPKTKEQKAWEPYAGEYIPTLDELTTTDGLANLKKEHPNAYNDFMKKMRSLGSSNPKIVELRTDYRGDIRKLTASQREKITKIGGLRVQSFSDFETPHLLDMMQAVLDMSSGKLTSQAYTKVPNFAWVFGDTGIKINLSLIAEGTGLDADGNLIFSSSEGMDFEEAMRLRDRYSQNVGTILVGVTDEHIRAAMADPRIDYIIPFHRSGWGQNELKKVSVLQSYTDYQATQNERKLDGSKPEGGNFYPIDYWDYSKTGDENAVTYLRMCEEDGRIPKFEQFLTKDADGHWVAPSGYWKMLIDFKMYDNDGNGSPQQTVQPNFNMQEAERVLSEYKGGANTLPVAYDIVDKFVSEYKAANPRQQYALPSDNMLTEMVDSYLMQNEVPTQPQRPQGERQFVAQTMPNTEAVPEWIWREFQRNPDELNYDIDTNREQVERGWQRIQQEGYDNELNRLMDAERFSADDTAEANLMMAMALRNEDPGTFMALASKYNKEGTEAGKELQARKLFSKMTPTGAHIWVAGKLEAGLGEFIRKHRPLKQQVDQRAQEIADEIRNLDSSDQVLRLMSGEETTIDSSNNRWGIPINQQQQALIDHYGLGNVARPGIYYNRATTKQRMLEAILATPNPLALTGNGLNLIQRLEFMSEGAAVITNADLNYIGSRLSEFVAYGAENGGREADVAVARAYEAFGNITPATRGEKARTWRYVAMLTSVPSAIRNIIGNASQNLVNAASHGIAVEIDKLLAGRTGQRTAAHLDIQERVQGWRSFVEESRNVFRDYFVDRVTTQRGEDKFNTHQRGRVYQTQALEAVRNVEGFLMSFGDRNIWRKAYVNSIAEQQKLADQNLLFNDDGTTRTHEQILEQAEADANYATFSEDSQLSTIMGRLKRIPGIGAIVDFIMPFTGVPTNITRRMIQYSPAGIATAAYRAAVDHHRGENFDQHRFVNDLSRGLTGTAMMGLGVLLAEMGAIKLGTGEEEDKKKYALQTAMGQQYTPYILNPFTNEYVSLSVFSPAASAITMGAAAYNDFKENDSALQAIKSAAFGSFDQIFDASYMSSLSDLFSGQGSVGENLIDTVTSSAISQNVPAVLGQLANALDPYVRDTKDKSAIMQAFKSGVINKIPFLRNAVLPEKVDVTGQTVRTKEGIRNFFDPFTTTDRREDPAIDELFRLNETLGASNMLPSDALSGTKMTLTVSVKEGKKSKSKKVTVDAKGKETYRKRYGELWLEGGTTLDKSGKRNEVEGVRSLINSKAYQRMDDVERAEAIADILSEAKIGAGMEALNASGPDAEEE